MVFIANPNKEKTLELCYSSLQVDEQNRSQRAHRMGEGPRFRPVPVNGNLASVEPAVRDEAVRATLPRHMQVDTNTRTVFHDEFYRPKDGVAEYAEAPLRTAHSVTAQPHLPMNELATADTRIRRMKPPYEAALGPGSYEPDPLGERATASLQVAPGEVHHTVQYARDPTRPSAVFVSAERGRTARDVAEAAAQPPISSRMTDPDWGHWTSKGCWLPRSERSVEADRWGPTARERRPPADERPDSIYIPTVTTDGHPASCEAYTSQRLAPAYRAAFASGLPRTTALPLGNRPDTRLVVKSYNDNSPGGPEVGPGSYNPEPPRMRSANAAYEDSSPYYSLASGVPPTGVASMLGGRLDAAHLPSLQHATGLRGSGSFALPAALVLPGSPGRAGAGTRGDTWAHGTRSEPSSPSALRAAAARAERAATAAMLAAAHSASERGVAAGAWGVPPSPLGAGGHGHGQGAGQGGMEVAGGSLSPLASRAQSAPVAPRSPGGPSSPARTAATKQFRKLVFNQRHTPCSSLLRSHLTVTAELRKERQRVRNGG